jgi:hypothetical protein
MYSQGFLSEGCKITKVADAAGAATSDVTGSTIDMAGFDGVMFLTSFGTPAADNTMHAEQGAASNMSDAADLEGSEVDVGASDEDLFIDILRPRERYVRVVLTRGTSTTVGDVWAIQYRAKDGVSVDNETAGTIAGKKLVYPAEGTK